MSRRWSRLTVMLLASLAVAAGAGVAYVRLAPRRTPQGQPPLVRLADGNLTPFLEAFNARPDSTRILMLLSPT